MSLYNAALVLNELKIHIRRWTISLKDTLHAGHGYLSDNGEQQVHAWHFISFKSSILSINPVWYVLVMCSNSSWWWRAWILPTWQRWVLVYTETAHLASSQHRCHHIRLLQPIRCNWYAAMRAVLTPDSSSDLCPNSCPDSSPDLCLDSSTESCPDSWLLFWLVLTPGSCSDSSWLLTLVLTPDQTLVG